MDFETFIETLDFDDFPPIENAYHHENEGCYTGDSRHTNVIATMVSGLGLVNIVDIQAADQAQALLQLASEIMPRIPKDDGIYTSKQSNTGNQNFSASKQLQTNGFTIERVRSIEAKDSYLHLANVTQILCKKKTVKLEQ